MTFRLHYLLELLATEKMNQPQFLAELDSLQNYLLESAQAIQRLDFQGYPQGKRLQVQYQDNLEALLEALDWMRDFARSGELELAEKSVGLSESAELGLQQVRAAIMEELEEG